MQVKEAELKAALQSGGAFVWSLSLPKNAAGDQVAGFAQASPHHLNAITVVTNRMPG